MKTLMISPTNRNFISRNNSEFFFNKLLESKGIEKRNDVLTRETVRTNFF